MKPHAHSGQFVRGAHNPRFSTIDSGQGLCMERNARIAFLIIPVMSEAIDATDRDRFATKQPRNLAICCA